MCKKNSSGTDYASLEYVIPANAGIQGDIPYWMPALAGMTIKLYHYQKNRNGTK